MDRSVNPDNIAFKDKTRERQRQLNLLKAAAAAPKPIITKSTTIKREAWSESKARKHRREEGREKKAKKRKDAEAEQINNEEDCEIAEDWKEHKRELREAKGNR